MRMKKRLDQRRYHEVYDVSSNGEGRHTIFCGSTMDDVTLLTILQRLLLLCSFNAAHPPYSHPSFAIVAQESVVQLTSYVGVDERVSEPRSKHVDVA